MLLALLLARVQCMSISEWWHLSPTYLNVTCIGCALILLGIGIPVFSRRIIGRKPKPTLPPAKKDSKYTYEKRENVTVELQSNRGGPRVKLQLSRELAHNLEWALRSRLIDGQNDT